VPADLIRAGAIQQDVLELDVAVRDPPRVAAGQRLHNLEHVAGGRAPGRVSPHPGPPAHLHPGHPGRHVLLEVLLPAAREFRHQPDRVAHRADLLQADDLHIGKG
jgi:hypothetical protein